ncbi:MAG TPA: hypothetical protein VKX17_15390 [Planctomycetota bacterium]|nr:hypothetical protein [Planctomycetota bacterium]
MEEVKPDSPESQPTPPRDDEWWRTIVSAAAIPIFFFCAAVWMTPVFDFGRRQSQGAFGMAAVALAAFLIAPPRIRQVWCVIWVATVLGSIVWGLI